MAFTKDELQPIVDRRFENIPFTDEKINDDISNRYYRQQYFACNALSKIKERHFRWQQDQERQELQFQ